MLAGVRNAPPIRDPDKSRSRVTRHPSPGDLPADGRTETQAHATALHRTRRLSEPAIVETQRKPDIDATQVEPTDDIRSTDHQTARVNVARFPADLADDVGVDTAEARFTHVPRRPARMIVRLLTSITLPSAAHRQVTATARRCRCGDPCVVSVHTRAGWSSGSTLAVRWRKPTGSDTIASEHRRHSSPEIS